MKNKIIIILVFAIGVFRFLHAQQATQIEVTNAAINTLMYESDLGLYYSTDSIANIYTKSLNGNIVLYEFLFTNGSSVLVSANKSCTPVLAVFSSETDDPINGVLNNYYDLPEALRDLIDAYAQEIDSCFENNVVTYDFVQEWNTIQQYNPYYRSSGNTKGPLLTTKWGQEESNDNEPEAYNYYVTKISPVCSYAKCPAGCAAVAMAQIMRYLQYPNNIPYKCSQFNWNNMPDKLIYQNNGNYVTERNTIASFLQDCGQRVSMKYCPGDQICASGASIDTVYYAMLSQYGFTDAVYERKMDYSNEQWGIKLRNNIDDEVPVLYKGQYALTEGGHAFVCDGYKKRVGTNEYRYHFNFGHLGKKDGWFNIDKITSFHPFYYAFYQEAIFDLYPTPNCWQNIIMECAKYFYNGNSKNFAAKDSFENNNYNFYIYSGADVNIQAGSDIYLTNGFYAAIGSQFRASIASCGSSKGMGEGDEVVSLFQDTIPPFKSMQKMSVTPSGVSVYPNPVTGTLHIVLLNPEESVKQVLVTNLLGNVVLQQDDLPDGTINTTPLANGMYIARICTIDGKTYHAKFVKK